MEQPATNARAPHFASERWPHVIASIGALLGLVLVLELVLLATRPITAVDGYTAGVVSSAPLVVWIVYGAYWLARSDISKARYNRVGNWCVLGSIVFTVFIVPISMASQPLTSFNLIATIRWSAIVGVSIGLGVGLFDARALERTFEAGQAVTRQEETQRERDRLEEFASIVSHDLRNPLNVVDGRLELAHEECESEHLEEAAMALERMNAIIDGTLTLARQGRTVGATEPVELAAIVEQCWRMVQTDAAELSIEDPGPVLADADRLRNALENLIRNAVEHAGPVVTVRIGPLADGTGFYVEDDGPGIPDDRRTEVFEPGATGLDGGTGFGLAIVKRVVEAHGWDVRVTDGAERGARFEITGVESASL